MQLGKRQAREPATFRESSFTGNQSARNEPSGSTRRLAVTTAESVADKEPKEQLNSQTLIRLRRMHGTGRKPRSTGVQGLRIAPSRITR